MLNYTDILVLNPAYYLKNDGNKIIFCTRENLKGVKIPYESFFSYLHPLNAQLLSFFNGENLLRDAINKASLHFKMTKDEIYNIVSELIENQEGKSIRYKWHWMYFPKNVLVNINKVDKHHASELNSFLTYDKVDLGAFRLSAPISANLLLTMKCYTDCIYCYANRQVNYNLMSLTQVKSIIHQAKDLNMMNLDVNGGEVLLHPYCIEIFSEMIKCGFYPAISTKIPISRDTILRLKEIGVKSIQLSLDTISPSILTELLQVNGHYFQKIDQTLHFLDQEGIDTTIHSVLCTQNSSINDLSELVKYLSSFSCIVDIRFSPAGYSLYKGNNSAFRPSLSELLEVSAYVENYNKTNVNNKIILDDYYTKDYYQDENLFYNRAICTANLRSFTILPDGRVTICEELYDHPQFIIGDLTKQTIMEVWNSSKALELFHLKKEKVDKESKCYNCSEFRKCREVRGVCWKEILMAYGKDKWDYPDPRCPKAPEMNNTIYTL